MLLFKKFIIFTFIIILSSCGGGKEKVSIIEEEDIDLQMVDAFRKGYEALQEGDVLFAAKKLMKQNFFIHNLFGHPNLHSWQLTHTIVKITIIDAIIELKRFIKTYPNDKNISYAHFLLGICHL